MLSMHSLLSLLAAFCREAMATLTIRDLDDEVKARLRVRAAEHGRSMEAEARELLAAALVGPRMPQRLGSFIHQQFADLGGLELSIPSREEPARTVDFKP